MRRLMMCAAVRSGGGVVLATLLAACGGASDGLKKQVKEMETEVTALRADQERLEERLEAIELSSAVVARDSAATPDAEERPRLKVIRLAPDAPPTGATTPSARPAPQGAQADEPRPVIKGSGDNVTRSGGSARHAPKQDRDRPVIALHGDHTPQTGHRGD